MNARKTAFLVLAVGLLTVAGTLLLRSLRRSGDEHHPPSPNRGSRPEDGKSEAPKIPTEHSGQIEQPLPPGTPVGALRIFVHSGGTPVAEAEIAMVRHESKPIFRKTALDGSCLVDGLAAGEWEVGVRHARYLPASDHATVKEGTTADMAVGLQAGIRVLGRVTDAQGMSIPGVRVEVMDPEKHMPLNIGLHATTDSEGRYEIGAVPPLEAYLYFTSPRHRPAQKEMPSARAGETVVVDARLADANILSGRVQDESGVAIAGATLTAGNELASATTTDREGQFTFRLLGDKPVSLSASAKGFGSVYLRDVAPNTTGLVIRLPRAGWISGKIAADPFPEGCVVKVWWYDEALKNEIMVWGRLIAEPEFTVKRDLTPGSYRVEAEAPGYELEAPVSVTVERGRRTGDVVLRLRRKP